MSHSCRLLLYFHMHQPFYKELRGQSYKMPWVRLHALKNYADMPHLHAGYENLRIAYNLVPSLIEQIEDYQNDATDQFLQLSRIDAAELTREDKEFILSNFFQLNPRTQIGPLPRYKELLNLKGSQSREVTPTALNHFNETDYRDLQVLFNLAWSGWLLREVPAIQAAIAKGRNFTEEDKHAVLDAQSDFLEEVLEPYKKLKDAGLAELTSSPYYHPILPLLCDTNSARQALPSITLPEQHFSWPEDAALQIELAMEKHKKIFGAKPVGMWPSEGSVSNQACSLIAKSGIRWAATDATVLAHSLGISVDKLSAEQKYSPWEIETTAGPLTLFFRDTKFSDLLGFTYQHWSPGNAADDFINRIEKVAASFPKDTSPVIPVILDGENAWAYYEDNGREFLSLLYEKIAETEWLETILPQEFIGSKDYSPQQLDSLVAGSWIYGNLSTWIGHHEKNRGWELLAQARRDYEQVRENDDLDKANLQMAEKELLISEGSDWFWWYGDDHESAYAREFDSLFREHLANIYRFLSLDPPPEVYDAIKGSDTTSGIEAPLRLISPTLDGFETHYTEWINAGLYKPTGGSEMHQTSKLLGAIRFGFDEENIYLRFDGSRPFTEKPLKGYQLVVKITSPRRAEVRYTFAEGSPPVLDCDGVQTELTYGEGSHLEFALSWDDACGADVFAFNVILLDGDQEVEVHPRGNLISMRRADASYNAHMWLV